MLGRLKPELDGIDKELKDGQNPEFMENVKFCLSLVQPSNSSVFPLSPSPILTAPNTFDSAPKVAEEQNDIS